MSIFLAIAFLFGDRAEKNESKIEPVRECGDICMAIAYRNRNVAKIPDDLISQDTIDYAFNYMKCSARVIKSKGSISAKDSDQRADKVLQIGYESCLIERAAFTEELGKIIDYDGSRFDPDRVEYTASRIVAGLLIAMLEKDQDKSWWLRGYIGRMELGKLLEDARH